jgi:hypothetical protein
MFREAEFDLRREAFEFCAASADRAHPEKVRTRTARRVAIDHN